MSKKILLGAIVSSTLLATNVFAAECVSNSGNGSYGKITMACLQVSGKTKLNGTTVSGATTVSGKLDAEHAMLNQISVSGKTGLDDTTITGMSKISGTLVAKNSHLNQLDVSGKVELDKTIVNGSSKISGGLSAEKSKFNADIEISSDKIKLEKTQTKNIMVMSDDKNKVQNVYLNGSVVNGNIEFKNGNGVVHLKGKSSVTGKVIGGKMV